jgi:hypothetical protein
MRALVLVAAALVGAAGASAPRSANAAPMSPADACTAAAAAGPWKAVFGTRSTQSAAALLIRQAGHAGFKNLTTVAVSLGRIEIDLFGITTYRTGLDLVREARSAKLQVSIQPSRDRYCPDTDGDWEGIFGHPTTIPAAISLRSAVLKAGFVGAAIERDGVHDYEVEVSGLRSLSQGREFQKEAKSAGYRVALERS